VQKNGKIVEMIQPYHTVEQAAELYRLTREAG
jgi:hypothetical protein